MLILPKFRMLGGRRRVSGGGGSPTITFVGGSSSADNANVSMPGGIVSGDIAVLYDWAINTAGVTPPTDVTPSGWTQIDTQGADYFATYGLRGSISRKALDGTETTLTGLSGDFSGKTVMVYRKSSGAWGTPAGVVNDITTFPVTVTCVVGAAPLVALGGQFGISTVTMSPGPADNTEAGPGSGIGSYTSACGKILNSSPSNQDIVSGSGGNLGIWALYIPVI